MTSLYNYLHATDIDLADWHVNIGMATHIKYLLLKVTCNWKIDSMCVNPENPDVGCAPHYGC
jgi:hypothetical protein